MKTFIFCILVSLLFGCTSSSEKEAWRIATQSTANSKELVRFLDYYKKKGDRDKYIAACFLVENMPNKFSLTDNGNKRIYDIDIVKADSLIISLEYSFRLKDESPFLKKYTFEQFCEYILPYRVANEPLQYYWKWDCVKQFGDGTSHNDIIDAARDINSGIKLVLSPDFYKDSLKSYSVLMQTGYGKCDDRSTLAVMALRSAGIPAAFEFIPYWGSSNNAHSFASVILPNDSLVPFQSNDENKGDNGLPIRKMPKVYRKVYTITPIIDFDTSLTYPDLFLNSDIIDVTNKHKIRSRNVSLDLQKDKVTYLSVFSPGGWIPVDISLDGSFQHVGTGTQMGEKDSEEALDLGDGILYMPCVYTMDELYPISVPWIISDNSISCLIPDTLHVETVKLTRKYPLNKRIVRFARNMLGGIFEGSNRRDFSDAEEIYRITNIPESKMQKVDLITKKDYRYIRYRKPKGVFSIAEFSLYKPDGTYLPFTSIACEAIKADSCMTVIFDNNPLTYYQVDGGLDMWIGADLHEAIKLGGISFAPRNDDNAVVPTDIYELFYWDGQWNSLGKQTSTRDYLVYDNVPKNSLLWLRDLTKGKEERPFTYEYDRQVWW